MSNSIRQFLVGPAVTVATGIALVLVERYVLRLPTPGAPMLFPVLFAAYYGGLASGLVSLGIAMGFVAAIVRGGEPASALDLAAATRLAMFFAFTLATVIVVSHLRRRALRTREAERDALRQMHAANQDINHLRTALDHINLGVMLLDPDLRLRYLNRAMRALGNVPAAIQDARPALKDLLHFACETGVFPVPPEQRATFVETRIDRVRNADQTPADLRLGDGGIARTQCAPLPDGSRLMVYTIVTDLVRQNEELSAFQAAFDQSEVGLVLLDQNLHARYINRAYRRLWNMSDAYAEDRPHYADMMRRSTASGIIDMPSSDPIAYFNRRIEDVRAGDPTPLDLKLTSGEVLRFRCAALPDGGRLLSYSGIGDLVHQAERLEELATTDSLTGLFNRRHFFELADAEWERTTRYARPLSVLMIDIDRFKAINDAFGHDTGDQVIAMVADICREQRRTSDIAARLGGEEFVLMLPETGAEVARTVAERLRELVAKRQVTVSIGVAQAEAGMTDVHDVIKAADRALYVAKRSGRNRVCGPADLLEDLPAQTSNAA